MQRLVLAIVACVAVFSCSAVAQDDDELAELRGKWKLSAVEIGGRAGELPEDPIVWQIMGRKVVYGGTELADLVIDSTTMPKTIDLVFRGTGKVYEGLYELEGKTLRICVNNQTDGVKERPPALDTKDRPTFRLLTFTRASGDEPSLERGYVGMAMMFDADRSAVVITSVLPDSPAKKAGLQAEDVLLSIGGMQATDLESTVRFVRLTKPGAKLSITVRRGGEEKEIPVTAGPFPFELLGILG